MPIRLSTPLSEIDAYIDRMTERARESLIEVLCQVGSDCINEARENGDYNNPTGNLRSSIGYEVIVDGQVYDQAVVEQTKNGVEGRAAAYSYMAKLVSEHPTGICLIVVAGMNYAFYVESLHGRNVLASAELLADRRLQHKLEQLGFTIKRI